MDEKFPHPSKPHPYSPLCSAVTGSLKPLQSCRSGPGRFSWFSSGRRSAITAPIARRTPSACSASGSCPMGGSSSHYRSRARRGRSLRGAALRPPRCGNISRRAQQSPILCAHRACTVSAPSLHGCCTLRVRFSRQDRSPRHSSENENQTSNAASPTDPAAAGAGCLSNACGRRRSL